MSIWMIIVKENDDWCIVPAISRCIVYQPSSSYNSNATRWCYLLTILSSLDFTWPFLTWSFIFYILICVYFSEVEPLEIWFDFLLLIAIHAWFYVLCWSIPYYLLRLFCKHRHDKEWPCKWPCWLHCRWVFVSPRLPVTRWQFCVWCLIFWLDIA